MQRALEYLDVDSVITHDRNDILSSDGAILPGVGAFGEAVKRLNEFDLIPSILDFIDSGNPFMGICLGMQLLFSRSHEFGLHDGLNIFKGDIVRFENTNQQGEKMRVPHISWSRINGADRKDRFPDQSLLSNTSIGTYMYFVHSYYAVPENQEDILSTSSYCGVEYCSGVKKGNVEAFQFHPEKSGPEGLRILEKFKEDIKNHR